MPSRNVVREYAADSYYHVYNRGVNKRRIFMDDEDYAVFLSLLKRHLSKTKQYDKSGREYANLYGELELLAFCLMPNHFHLLIYQSENPDAITSLMRSIGTAYTMYFNRRHKRVGHLFQDRFKASKVSDDGYLQHISRYIHLNPKHYESYQWSSLDYYLTRKSAEWVCPKKILKLFDGNDYRSFVADYEDQKKVWNEIKYELADAKVSYY